MIKFGSSNRNMHASYVCVCAWVGAIRTLFIHLGTHGFFHNIHIVVRGYSLNAEIMINWLMLPDDRSLGHRCNSFASDVCNARQRATNARGPISKFSNFFSGAHLVWVCVCVRRTFLHRINFVCRFAKQNGVTVRRSSSSKFDCENL